MSKKVTKLGSSFNCCPLGNVDWSRFDVNLRLRSILGLLRSLHNGLRFIEKVLVKFFVP